MERSEIIEKLTPIVRSVFANDAIVLSDNMSAENTPNWTSLSFMQLLTEIENHFGFKFRMMELLQLHDMGAVIDTIYAHTHTHTHTHTRRDR